MSHTELIVSEADGVTVVDFRNVAVLDAAAAGEVAAELCRLVDDRKRRRILLDLTAVRFLASQMIGALVTLHKKSRDIDGTLVICGLAANLFRVFEFSRLDQVLLFAPDVERGRRMLGPPGPAEAAPAPPPGEAHPSGWSAGIQRQIRILFAGAMVIVPLAITAWVVWSVGTWLDELGREAFARIGTGFKPPHGTGALILVGVIYLVGLLTHLWLFRGLFGLLERLIVRLPGAKTIYESVRDLMRLFGGQGRRMGRVVQYHLPGTDVAMLGILTNENPLGAAEGQPHRKVAVYFPFSYMIGGSTVFVSPEHIVEVDMTVEQCMKLCATAQVGSGPIVGPAKTAAKDGKAGSAAGAEAEEAGKPATSGRKSPRSPRS